MIINPPPPIAFVGNLDDIEISTALGECTVQLFVGEQPVLSETYAPDHGGRFRLKLKNLLDQLLYATVPPFSDETAEQPNLAKTVRLAVQGEDEITFTAVKGGLDAQHISAADFLAANFLTWQPQTKTVEFHRPEWLTYYAAEAVDLVARGYAYESTETVTLASLPPGRAHTVSTNFGLLMSRFQQQPKYVDVWAENGAGDRLTYVQRYILRTDRPKDGDLFVFENTLGGVDAICFEGQTTIVSTPRAKASLFDEVEVEYLVDHELLVKKNTGHIPSEADRVHALDFFVSPRKKVLKNSALVDIVLKATGLDHTVGELNDYTFTYKAARNTPYKNLGRTHEPPPVLEILSPDDELFFLAPRLNELPAPAQLSSLLIPVQGAYAPYWMKLTMHQLVAHIAARLSVAPDGTAQNALHALDSDKWDGHTFEEWMDQPVRTADSVQFAAATTGSLAVTAELLPPEAPGPAPGALWKAGSFLMLGAAKAWAGRADLWNGLPQMDYLTQPVRPADSPMFEGIGSQSFASGFAGSGYRMARDANGDYLMEVDRMLVRKDFSAHELVLSKIRATNGSLWVSDAVRITGATASGANFACTIDTDGGTIAVPFAENDILRCQVFNGTGLKYYAARVVSAAAATFTITILEGTGSPAAGDDLVRIGSTASAARQGALYLTASDGGAPFMDVVDGVSSPSLAGRTKVRIGKLDGIADPDFGPLAGYGIYAQNGYFKGRVQVATGSNVHTRAEAAAQLAAAKAEAIGTANDFTNSALGALQTETSTQFSVMDGLINTKVAQTDFNALNQRVGTAETAITQHAGQIALRAAKTEVNAQVATAKGEAIGTASADAATKASNARTGAVSDAKTYTDGKASAINADITAIATRVTNAETAITQNAGQISLKATMTEVAQLATAVSGKAGQPSVTALEGRMASAELKIKPAAINLTVRAQAEEIAARRQHGRMMYRDPTFESGYNGITRYNNFGNGNVTVLREPAPVGAAQPTGAGHRLKITCTGPAKPGIGGFTWLTPAYANAHFLIKLIAHIPTGYTIAWASNPIGTGGYHRWLTARAGASDWREYICEVTCGPGGDFQATNYIWLAGPDGTPAAPVVWYVCYATVHNLSQADDTPDRSEIKAGIQITPNAISVFGQAISMAGKVTFASLDPGAQGQIAGAQAAAATADGKAVTAQNAANTAQSAAATASANLAALQAALGGMAYEDTVQAAKLGSTIIEGGLIKTSLINVQTLMAQTIVATGQITASNLHVTGTSKVGGFSIEGNKLVNSAPDTAIAFDGLAGNGTFLRMNTNPTGPIMSMRTDQPGRSGLTISTYTANATGLYIINNASYGTGRAIKSYGSHELVQRGGEKWNAPGALGVVFVDIFPWTHNLMRSWTTAAVSASFSHTGLRRFRWTHNLGHTDYICTASIPNNNVSVADVGYTANYCEVTVHPYDSMVYITMFGRNKVII